MGFAQWMGVIDTVGGLVQMARRYRRGDSLVDASSSLGGPIGQIETRLAGVVVAALKEAFDRDSARLELERTHIEAERRRAEEALRAELRRQAADRLIGQLRTIAVMAIGTWALSAALGVWMPGMRLGLPRVLLGIGWLFALSALGASFAGWHRVSAWSGEIGTRGSGLGTRGSSLDRARDDPGFVEGSELSGPLILPGHASTFAPWLLVAAVALTGASLLAAL
jgi:hypothetical protein